MAPRMLRDDSAARAHATPQRPRGMQAARGWIHSGHPLSPHISTKSQLLTLKIKKVWQFISLAILAQSATNLVMP